MVMNLKTALQIYVETLLPVGTEVKECGVSLSVERAMDPTYGEGEIELVHKVWVHYYTLPDRVKTKYMEFNIPYFDLLNSLLSIASGYPGMGYPGMIP